MSQADGQKVHQDTVGVIRLREPSLAYVFLHLSAESIPRRADSDKPPALVAGGAEEARTPDLRLAKAALSQLSYGPVLWINRWW